MKIKDKPDFYNKPKPVTFSPDASIQEALNVMCEKNIGSIVIVNPDQTVLGILTERDMMIRVLGPDLDPKVTKLQDVMSTHVRTANENDNMVDWMHTMSTERFRHLPVVDTEGKIVNMISQGDFVAHTFPDLYDALRQDLKGRLGRGFQLALCVFAALTLGLIAFGF